MSTALNRIDKYMKRIVDGTLSNVLISLRKEIFILQDNLNSKMLENNLIAANILSNERGNYIPA